MNPIVAEIFPVMAKFFKNDFLEARALLDYKWFVVPLKEEDPNDQNIFKKSIDDFVNLCATEGRENVIQPENFPLPFEKFFMVLSSYLKITTGPLRSTSRRSLDMKTGYTPRSTT